MFSIIYLSFDFSYTNLRLSTMAVLTTQPEGLTNIGIKKRLRKHSIPSKSEKIKKLF